MRFFHPNPKFWALFEKLARQKAVVELGCGDGDLLREMRAAGYKAMGIDPRFTWGIEMPEDLRTCILPHEAEDAGMIQGTPNMVLLCCRPCHTGFPGMVNRSRHPDSFMYYVGFAKNLENDLLGAEVKRVSHGYVGAEGEGMWEVMKS